MKVRLRPRAEENLVELYRYIAHRSGSADVAFAYVWRLREACLSLSDFPMQGAPRDDIVKGLRILPFEKRSVIAYFVKESGVEIAAIFHGGQDWHTLIGEDES